MDGRTDERTFVVPLFLGWGVRRFVGSSVRRFVVVALWRCRVVALWRCGVVALSHRPPTGVQTADSKSHQAPALFIIIVVDIIYFFALVSLSLSQSYQHNAHATNNAVPTPRHRSFFTAIVILVPQQRVRT